ncbi:3',5'-cyclic adenosine monophosphate phosphodiesterase CpdA [anaerobic digester metagenome]
MHLKYIFFIQLLIFSINGNSQFIHQRQVSGANPWTSAPEISGDNYRFIVAGDITGGEEPGVLAEAVHRINELSPDFVITVGDLIDGYTTDSLRAEKQWDDFLKVIGNLEMPFFFTAGNHDITNPMLEDIWNRRFGSLWYSFKVGSSLFFVINSAGIANKGFDAGQLEYFKSRLENHNLDAPVFIFMHYPAKEMADNDHFVEFSRLLMNYNAYWFCGHEHRYVYEKFNGQPHIMLAGLATGGPGMRGYALGEFHNLMQISVRGNGVNIANLDLAGLLPVDVVNPATIKQVDVLRSGNWADTEVVYSTDRMVSSVFTRMLLKNEGEYPLHVSGSFTSEKNISINPVRIDTLIQPAKTSLIPVEFSAPEKFDLDGLNGITFNSTAEFYQPGAALKATHELIVLSDYLRNCHYSVDPQVSFTDTEVPFEIEEDWDWKGNHDASFSLETTHDEKHIHISVKITDDRWVMSDQRAHDKLLVYFSPETTANPQQAFQFQFNAGEGSAKVVSASGRKIKFRSSAEINGDQMYINLSVPAGMVKTGYFRLNLIYTDVDDPSGTDHTRLNWRPWETAGSWNKGAGIFLIK